MEKKFKKLSTPYLVWLYVLALIPAGVMIFLMFIDTEGFDLEGIKFTLANFKQLTERATLIAFRNSLCLAALSTFICIILGYLVAYKLFRSKFQNKFLVLVILILPMWSNLLLRTEALANIMDSNNILSDLLSRVGIDVSLHLRGTVGAVIFGLIFTYLPFMILPIYTALEKIDRSVEEAAIDLGMTEMQKFWKVIVPISAKGIVTGSILTFLPCLSGFAIPEILGSGNVVMIGNVIEQLFKNMNYNTGSLLAVFILLLILISITLVNKFDKEGETLI